MPNGLVGLIIIIDIGLLQSVKVMRRYLSDAECGIFKVFSVPFACAQYDQLPGWPKGTHLMWILGDDVGVGVVSKRP